MMTTRNHHRTVRTATVFASMGAALVLTAAPALAANTVDITVAAPSSVGVEYNCGADAGVTSIKVMAGEPTAERPAALGTQNDVACDGSQHVATVSLAGAAGEAPLASGAVVQIRAALVDQNDVVISGQAKVLTLQ
ncbi:hypothetical protein ACLMAL_20325 [Nocardia sp. CWNU-33]|uniref:hypothetical protein n=1 Tax=Nocardia sp. CWNU-33 TaxID=3392117 RepID=UPI00398F7CEE